MTIDEYRNELLKIEYICGMNQKYHQRLQWRWGMGEKAVKVILAMCAVVGLIHTISDIAPIWIAVALGIASTVAALVLNVAPLGDRENDHHDMFSRWSDLRGDVEVEAIKVVRNSRSDKPGEAAIERLEELTAKKNNLHASESCAFPKLLLKCQQAENRSRGWSDSTSSGLALSAPLVPTARLE